MYLRYTQPPGDLYDWYEDYLQDEEEVDAKAGGGQTMTIGQMIHQWLIKLDWFSTLFPRIPVPIQKQIEKRLEEYSRKNNVNLQARYMTVEREQGGGAASGSAGKRDGREYFDRNPGGSKRNEHRDDRRYRSRSREKPASDNRDSRRDRDHRGDYHKTQDKSYRGRERGGREKDYYYRDGEGSSDQYSSSSRHRDRDRKYR